MNTKLLTLFAAFLIYYSVAPDIQLENEKLIGDIRLIEHKASVENNITNLMKTTHQLVKQNRLINENNRDLFIDATLPDALAFAALQQKIRDDSKTTKVELSNLSWGEPSQNPDTPYTLLPMSIALKGTPVACGDFLNRLYQYNKLITIENLSIVQYQETLSMVIDLYMYRITPVQKQEGK